MKKITFLLTTILLLSACSSMFPHTEDLPAETIQPVITNEPTPAVTKAPSSYDGTDSKGTGWGMVRKKGAPPDVDMKGKTMLEEHNGFYIDHSGEKNLYLTFDEGYENGFTSKILDTLAEKQVPAAFFVTGPYLENQPELIKRMIDEGHIIGNHTVNHLDLPKQTAQKVQQELGELNEKCKSTYGISMTYMRPPEGEYSEKVLSVAEDMGYSTVLWSFAYKDWDVNLQKGEDYAYEQITQYLHDGSIILLHAVSSDNAAALGKVIDYARDKGYEFKSLEYLHNLK